MGWSTPRTWVAGETVTAALLNTELRDNLDAVSGVWQAWIPTVGGVTVGNATILARYARIGGTVSFHYAFIVGSTTSITGPHTFTLPVNATGTPSCTATLHDITAGLFAGAGLLASASTILVRGLAVSGSHLVHEEISSTAPFTWATGDLILCEATYEVA